MDRVGGSGYITVFFSMIFLTVISVVLSALEAVRVSSVRMQAEIACAISCEAYLSQYQPQVQARYGLYLIQRDGYDRAFLERFIEQNCGNSGGLTEGSRQWLSSDLESVVIEEDRSIYDEDFQYLENQINELMVALKGADYAQDILRKLSGEKISDVEKEKDQLTYRMENTGAAADAQKREEAEYNDSMSDDIADSSDDQHVKDPREALTMLLKYPILSLLMDDNISDATLDIESLSDFVSPEHGVTAFSGFMDYRDITQHLKENSLDIFDITETIPKSFLTDCYIMDYFSTATNLNKTGDHSALAYEVEYILSGNSSDASNLQTVINRISIIRMVMNMVYLMGNTAKSSAVRAVAAALSAALLMPFLEEIFYLLILAAWAYGEALMDCRRLLDGKTVPFLKDDRTWMLSLEQLGNISAGQLKQWSCEDDFSEGMNYEDYLRLLLLGVSRDKKYIRLLNLIEANTRLEDGCDSFLLKDCVLGIGVCADFVFYPLFYPNILGNNSYEHHVRRFIAY